MTIIFYRREKYRVFVFVLLLKWRFFRLRGGTSETWTTYRLWNRCWRLYLNPSFSRTVTFFGTLSFEKGCLSRGSWEAITSVLIVTFTLYRAKEPPNIKNPQKVIKVTTNKSSGISYRHFIKWRKEMGSNIHIYIYIYIFIVYLHTQRLLETPKSVFLVFISKTT